MPAPSLTDADVYLTGECELPDVSYWPADTWVSPSLLEAARGELLALVPKGEARMWTTLPDRTHAIGMLGTIAALTAHTRMPVAALAHHNVRLGYHTDRRNPGRCTNLTVVFRDRTRGGELVIPPSATEAADGSLTAFNGQQRHGPTPVTGTGYRIALTYYAPT